ncbi:MAG: recombination mediator RecR [Bacteroidaceae bacterium]|nr:recombination mediator RecR [Bacteroidaceae bacterium]MDE6159110.1 recombination mediator RecR [Bacteroidaceae bacterium]
MSSQQISSSLLQRAVEEFSKLPGIGEKTAMRLVLHLLRQEQTAVDTFGNSVIQLRQNVQFCKICHNISDTEICPICSNPRRDESTICVVEDIQDVMAIENTQQYRGVYHVLGGVISPMDGVGPGDLYIDSLIERAAKEEVKEIILALNPTMEGDTTNFYLYRRLAPLDVKVSVIARGVAQNDELQYTDEITLGRSIVNRTTFMVNV